MNTDSRSDNGLPVDEPEKSGLSSNGPSAEEPRAPDASPESGASGDVAGPMPVEATTTEEHAADEGLPEWVPLTPELVEDEAIRGDFMLRWCVVLLAGFLACRSIAESEVLVHIKTGEYSATHGWWPPRHDVFSYTATEHPWINLEWLFDLTAAGVHAVAGPAGLSLLAALLGAVTFLFITHTSRPDLPTWWGSVSAALALVVCYPLFTAWPESLTFVGIAVTLWLLNDWSQSESSPRIWWLVPLMLVWANTDRRMFLGLLLLILYGLGDLAGAAFGRPGFANQTHPSATGSASATRRQFWVVTVACFLVTLLNPFGWNSWLSPLTLYGVEYPALREHYGVTPSLRELQCFPLYSPVFWRSWDHHLAAALTVLILAPVTMALNREKLNLAHVLVYAGFLGLGVLTSHELAAACLVAAVIGTLNAQDWYQRTFRQTYSIDTWELLWTRGGRALTVLCLFALAFLGLNGVIMSHYGYRVGFGFSPGLRNSIDGYQKELVDAFDDRPFTFRLEQGDLVIWAGRRPFLDSRVAVYAGAGDADVLSLHDKTRYALRRAMPESPGGVATSPKSTWLGRPEVWKATFDRFQITHVVPRLSGDRPDYVTYFDLLSSPEQWQLTRLGAVTAVFHRSDLEDATLKQYLGEHRVDFVKDAFRVAGSSTIARREWPNSPSIYDKYLTPPAREPSNAVQRARHYLAHLDAASNQRVALSDGHAVAALHLAIRELHGAATAAPNDAQAYRNLGRAYELLGVLESRVAAVAGLSYSPQLRFYQSLSAYHQAMTAAPDDVFTQSRLTSLYLDFGRIDLALQALNRFDELTADRASLLGPALDLKVHAFQYREELTQRLIQFRENLKQAKEQSRDQLQLAREAYRVGFVLEALSLLEEDRYFVVQHPEAQLLQAVLLLEAGRLEEAGDLVRGFSGGDPQSDVSPLKHAFSFVHLACSDFAQATQVLSDVGTARERQTAERLLFTLPFVPPPPLFASQTRNGWPMLQVVAVGDYLYRFPEETEPLAWLRAQCDLEVGRIEEATRTMRALVDSNPETRLRPLLRFYLYLLTDELIELEPPSDWITPGPDLFEAEPPT